VSIHKVLRNFIGDILLLFEGLLPLGDTTGLIYRVRGFNTRLSLGLALLLLIVEPQFTYSQAQSTGERIAFAGYHNGQWDIYSIAPDGSDLRQLTADSFEDTDPAYAPNGTQIAFASRRNNNWDIYVLNLLTGEETRLTNAPHYDGAPTWQPDGQSLAYESYQAGDLDIWQVAANGSGSPLNLTATSPAGDFAPAWSPDGQSIAFTSWRNDNKDLFLLDVTGGAITPLTNTPTAEEWAVWHPGGEKLAFVIDNLGVREVFTLDTANPPTNGGPVEQVTWLGRTDGPAWSPSGETIAALFHRWDGEILTVQTPGAVYQLPHELTGVVTMQGRLAWHNQAVEFGQALPTFIDSGSSALYEESLTPNPPGAEPYNLIRQDDLTVGTPWLADTVDDSFQAWRLRLRQEVDYDFLSELSDASRTVSAYNDTSQYASWHKSGRAIDTLFDFHVDGRPVHEIVKEDYSGETYWRIFLRCLDQTGRCGRPIAANSWNYSRRARTEIAPAQGGLEKPNLFGYYVDMTAIAREYGWGRIASFDDEDYSWTWHFLAFEYWHYQKRLEDKTASETSAANWYQAMQHVYPQETLDRYFTWEQMRSLGEDPYLIALKGVPLPLEIKPWWALVEQAQ
jgi:TolB protein